MSLELKILASCFNDRTCYELATEVLDPKEITPETQRVLKFLGEYYGNDEATSKADRELVFGNVIASIPDHQDKHRKLFEEFLRRIPTEVSDGNISGYLSDIKLNRISNEIHQAIISKADNSEIGRAHV